MPAIHSRQHVVVVDLKTPRLREGAEPCIFHDLPSYLSSTKQMTLQKDPGHRKEAAQDWCSKAYEQWLDSMKISAFEEVQPSLQKNILDGFGFLDSMCNSDNIMLYRLHEREGVCP